ncbi:MAG: 4Fe-4S ferredoxin, partial [Thermoplasmata archaeon]|nr:4Fe-4S ferredoxin [Thermoplasmata archaeon]
MAKLIQKHNIADLFRELPGFEVYGPMEEDGVVLYRRITDSPLLDFENSKKPPKEIFFPQTEKMFELELKNNRFVGVKDPELPDKPLLLFGIRPCDARAMTVLDRLFTWDYIDPYYVNKRERATVIALTCTKPQANCFCTSVGGSPYSTDGADMLWT